MFLGIFFSFYNWITQQESYNNDVIPQTRFVLYHADNNTAHGSFIPRTSLHLKNKGKNTEGLILFWRFKLRTNFFLEEGLFVNDEKQWTYHFASKYTCCSSNLTLSTVQPRVAGVSHLWANFTFIFNYKSTEKQKSKHQSCLEPIGRQERWYYNPPYFC